MWLVDNQSIPKMTSRSFEGKHIRLILYLSLATTIGYFAHTNEVIIALVVVVESTSSMSYFLTNNLRILIQAYDMKEWITPKSNNINNCALDMEHIPITRLSDCEASPSLRMNTLSVSLSL